MCVCVYDCGRSAVRVVRKVKMMPNLPDEEDAKARDFWGFRMDGRAVDVKGYSGNNDAC